MLLKIKLFKHSLLYLNKCPITNNALNAAMIQINILHLFSTIVFIVEKRIGVKVVLSLRMMMTVNLLKE